MTVELICIYLEAFGIWAVSFAIHVLHSQLLSLTVIVPVLVGDVTVPKTFTDKFKRLSLRVTVNFIPYYVHIWHSTQCRFHWKFLKNRKFHNYYLVITVWFSIFSIFCFFSGFITFFVDFSLRANFWFLKLPLVSKRLIRSENRYDESSDFDFHDSR